MERTASAGPFCESEESGTISIDALDDALLSGVLFLAGKPSWPAIALTRRRWHTLLLSELWSTVRIETAQLDFLSRPRKEAWFQHKRALLQRVAPLVTAVAVHDRTGMLRSGAHGTAGAWGLPDLLGMLRPAVVADVELEVHPSPAVEALQALPPLAAGLTALNLDAQRLPPEAATMLLQLSGLRGLRLAAQHLPEGALPAILRLSLLSRLELESSFLPLPHMGSLTALRRLKQVRLMDDSERQDALQLPAPADFGAQGGLHSLTVYTRQTWQMADTRASFLFLHCTAPPYGQTGSTSVAEAAHAALTLHGHSRRDTGLGSLAALLASLLPPSRAAPLRLLHIGGFLRLSPAEVYGCPALAGVHHLGLVRCGPTGGGSSIEEAEAVLAALLSQMPALRELDLTGWLGSSLTACVAGSAAGVTKLVLAESGLTSVPCSACPAGLVELDLRHCDHLLLTDAEVDGLLHRCPELHTVRLERSAAAGGDAQAALAAALERRLRRQQEATNAVSGSRCLCAWIKLCCTIQTFRIKAPAVACGQRLALAPLGPLGAGMPGMLRALCSYAGRTKDTCIEFSTPSALQPRQGTDCGARSSPVVAASAVQPCLQILMGFDTGGAFYSENDAHNIQLFDAAMRQLPRLECLSLNVLPLPSEVVLPQGPWQHTLQQLVAPADLLECSLPELGKASRLRELCAAAIDKLDPQPIVRVLGWAAEQQAVPLRRLMLALGASKSPSVELLQACLDLKGRCPQLDIQPHKLKGGMPLHELFTPSPSYT